MFGRTASILASTEDWRKRPVDVQPETVADLRAYCEAVESASVEVPFGIETTRFKFDGGLGVKDANLGNLWLDLNQGDLRGSVAFSHYAFTQVANLVGLRAGDLRAKMPAGLAAALLQWNMERRKEGHGDGRGDAGKAYLIPPVDENLGQLRAFTSEGYGRIKDSVVLDNLQQAVDGRGWEVNHVKGRSTLFASDRNMFALLVRPQTRDIVGRPVNQGLLVENSTVGERACRVTRFTYDQFCTNLYIYSVGDEDSFSLRHTSGAPGRFLELFVPKVRELAERDDDKLARAMEAAKSVLVVKTTGRSDDEVKNDFVKWMRDRGFEKGDAEYAVKAQRAEGQDAPSLLNAVLGLTNAARAEGHADAQIDMSRRATNLLEQVWPSA